MNQSIDRENVNGANLLAERLIGLDLFRIFSVLMIFFFHTGHINCSYGILNAFVGEGAMFMTAFFMLSGFALFYTNHTKNMDGLSALKAFYLKRFISIVPVYWVIAILYTIYSVVINGESATTNIILVPIEALGLQSVFCSVFNISHNGGTWFVSCILFCYAIFPYGMSIVKQMNKKSRIVSAIVLIGILLYSPLIVGALNLDNIYSNPFFRICEFLIGVLLCSIWQEVRGTEQYKKVFAHYWMVLLEIAVLVVGVSVAKVLNIPDVMYMLYSWIGIPVFISMILSLCGLKLSGLRRSKLLKYAVEVSYVFFFAQFFTWPICRMIFKSYGGVDNMSVMVKAPVSLMICIVITLLLHELIEKPLMSILKRKYL